MGQIHYVLISSIFQKGEESRRLGNNLVEDWGKRRFNISIVTIFCFYLEQKFYISIVIIFSFSLYHLCYQGSNYPLYDLNQALNIDDGISRQPKKKGFDFVGQAS